MLDISKIDKASIEFEGWERGDYSDFCILRIILSDAYISSACWEDGTELTDDEMDELNDHDLYVYETLMSHLY